MLTGGIDQSTVYATIVYKHLHFIYLCFLAVFVAVLITRDLKGFTSLISY